jgi:hypothetical protein
MLVAANGAGGSAFGSGAVTLNGGTLTAGAAGGSTQGLVQGGAGAHVIAPGAGQGFAAYGTLSLNGGLTTNTYSTLLFNMNPVPITGSIYGGDLVNLGGSKLTVGGGTIAFVGGSPTALGDYRLFQNVGNTPALGNFTLPAAPAGDSFSWTTESGYTDLVLAAQAVANWVTANGSGSWTQGSNWTTNPTVPSSGIVTFGGAPAAPITVTLDGSQAAGGLVFNTSNGNGYMLVNGTGGPLSLGAGGAASIAIVSGTHKISAELALAGKLTVSATSGGEVELAGNVYDGGAGYGLTLTGNGELILSGTGNYLGPTAIDGGTMYLTNSTALPTGNALIVGAGGNFIFDPSTAFAPASGDPALSAHGVAEVPEPGTLALLGIAGLLAAAAACRRRTPS